MDHGVSVPVNAPEPIRLSSIVCGFPVLSCGELALICTEYGLKPTDYYKERL